MINRTMIRWNKVIDPNPLFSFCPPGVRSRWDAARRGPPPGLLPGGARRVRRKHAQDHTRAAHAHEEGETGGWVVVWLSWVGGWLYGCGGGGGVTGGFVRVEWVLFLLFVLRMYFWSFCVCFDGVFVLFFLVEFLDEKYKYWEKYPHFNLT